jgi:hypothetical protein
MKSTTAMAILVAILVAMLVSLAACDIRRGSERAPQGKSGDEGGSQESGRSQTKQEQPKKPETVKGEIAKKPSQEQQQKKPEPKPEPEPAPRNIPGLTPQDVYLNLENRGFKCSEPELMGPDNQVRWTCERQEAQGKYLVEISSSDANSVRLVEARVITYDPARADALAQDFLGYVARVPYEGAQPEEAKAWVEHNVGSKASAVFGGVWYTLGSKAGRHFLKLENLEG